MSSCWLWCQIRKQTFAKNVFCHLIWMIYHRFEGISRAIRDYVLLEVTTPSPNEHFSQQAFWLVIVGKTQVSLITSMLAPFFSCPNEPWQWDRDPESKAVLFISVLSYCDISKGPLWKIPIVHSIIKIENYQVQLSMFSITFSSHNTLLFLLT